MTAEEAAFVELVCASPEDDIPRLIYADWLDERDDPRGEFIRIQCALARLPAADPNRPALQDREATLLARHHGPWSEPLRGVADWTEFHRGFVETVNVTARRFLTRGADLFALAPVRHIRFLDVGSNLSRLADCRLLTRLTAVTVYAQHLREELPQALAASPHVSGIRRLNIGRNRFGDRGVHWLVRSPAFARLTALDLSDNTIRDAGARMIAESAHLANLHSLELRHNELTCVGLARLCSSPVLADLRKVGVAQNSVGAPYDGDPPAAGAVSLHSLDLSVNQLSVEGLREVLRLPGLMNLERLDIEHNEVGNAGAHELANWSGAVTLRSLCMADNRIGDDEARALARSNYLYRLTHLDMSDNPMHDPGAFEFLNSSALPRLKHLALPHLGLTPKIRGALAGRYSG